MEVIYDNLLGPAPFILLIIIEDWREKSTAATPVIIQTTTLPGYGSNP